MRSLTGLMALFLMLAPGCGEDDDKPACGEGIHLKDGECVPDEEADADTDGDLDADTDTDADADGDTAADSGTGPVPADSGETFDTGDSRG